MFNGKAIYNPSGKAGEYSYWACNFYVGCSNECTYCYLKKGRGSAILGGNKPKLKKCFKSEAHALKVFEKELLQNVDELRKHGLFFTFTSDPMLPECIDLTWDAVGNAIYNNVPVKILTKCTEWVTDFIIDSRPQSRIDIEHNKMYAFGFTLTGHDKLEPGASTNAERIEAMAKLHEAGFKTFASIEPIIDLESSKEMIRKTIGYCDLYKIGLESGRKYDSHEIKYFVDWCNAGFILQFGVYKLTNYFKDSVLKQAGINRKNLPSNCVTRKYNIFTGGDECLMTCTGCGEVFDIWDMKEDDGGEWFCNECWEVLGPLMKVETEELNTVSIAVDDGTNNQQIKH